MTYHDLDAALANNTDLQLERLCREYLPLSSVVVTETHRGRGIDLPSK